jgi:hypothetical protein
MERTILEKVDSVGQATQRNLTQELTNQLGVAKREIIDRIDGIGRELGHLNADGPRSGRA